MGIIKNLAVLGGGAYALAELAKTQNQNRSANVEVKTNVDALAVKEAIAKDPNLLQLVRGEKGDKGETGATGATGQKGLDGNYSLSNIELTPSTILIPKHPTANFSQIKMDGLTNRIRFFNYLDEFRIEFSTPLEQSWSNFFKISQDGSVSKIGGGSFTSISDERLKENIEVFNKGLESVLCIETKSFNYKKVLGTQTEFYPDSICNKTQYGVIAQELKEVCPEMVTQDEQGFYSVDLSNLPLMLVNAVKELSTKLDTVTTNYQALIQRVEALENPPATA